MLGVCGTFVRGMCAFGIGKSVWRLRDLIRFCGGYCTGSAFAYLYEVASWRKFFTRVLKAVWDFIWFYLKRIGNHFVNSCIAPCIIAIVFGVLESPSLQEKEGTLGHATSDLTSLIGIVSSGSCTM